MSSNLPPDASPKNPAVPTLPFLLFLGILGLGALEVTRPLVRPLAWGAVAAFLTHPLFAALNRRTRGRCPGLCATLTLLAALCFVLAPVSYLVTFLGQETSALVAAIARFNAQIQGGTPELWFSKLPPRIQETLGPLLQDRRLWGELVQKAGLWVGGLVAAGSSGLLQGTATFLYEASLALVSTFFLVRDGASMVAYLGSALPLPGEQKRAFLERSRDLLRSVLFGVLLTVALQAVLGGLGWWVAGLPNPVFSGFLMFLFGMVPLVGTALIWVPGGVYLLIAGHVKAGVLLLLWGALVVGSVDQFLRPLFISGRGGAPTFLVLLGILGGLSAWGFLGIFLGPLALALFLVVFDTYRRQWATEDAPEGTLPF